MNKNLLILFCLFSLMQVSRAQDPIFGEPQHSTLSADSLSDVVGLIPESLDANVDSLLHSWHVQYFSKVDEYCHDDAENVYFPDSVYEERLERLAECDPFALQRGGEGLYRPVCRTQA